MLRKTWGGSTTRAARAAERWSRVSRNAVSKRIPRQTRAHCAGTSAHTRAAQRLARKRLRRSSILHHRRRYQKLGMANTRGTIPLANIARPSDTPIAIHRQCWSTPISNSRPNQRKSKKHREGKEDSKRQIGKSQTAVCNPAERRAQQNRCTGSSRAKFPPQEHKHCCKEHKTQESDRQAAGKLWTQVAHSAQTGHPIK